MRPEPVATTQTPASVALAEGEADEVRPAEARIATAEPRIYEAPIAPSKRVELVP